MYENKAYEGGNFFTIYARNLYKWDEFRSEVETEPIFFTKKKANTKIEERIGVPEGQAFAEQYFNSWLQTEYNITHPCTFYSNMAFNGK